MPLTFKPAKKSKPFNMKAEEKKFRSLKKMKEDDLRKEVENTRARLLEQMEEVYHLRQKVDAYEDAIETFQTETGRIWAND